MMPWHKESGLRVSSYEDAFCDKLMAENSPRYITYFGSLYYLVNKNVLCTEYVPQIMVFCYTARPKYQCKHTI